MPPNAEALRKLALSVDNQMLTYLLDMAALEAANMEVTHSKAKEKKRFKPTLVA